jgi:hypothetical protein
VRNERFSVFVDDEPVEVYAGMKVLHALIAARPALYKACMKGEAVVRDKDGFLVGLDGALNEGTRLYTAPREKQP